MLTGAFSHLDRRSRLQTEGFGRRRDVAQYALPSVSASDEPIIPWQVRSFCSGTPGSILLQWRR